MADKEDTKSKLMWIAIGAGVTAGTIYFVNKALQEREEMKMHKFERELERRKLSGE
jgi:hypothetical protein